MASEDDLIEAAPCPSCRSPLTVAVSDLGHLVECPGCGTQFRARRPGPAAEEPRPPRPARDEPPPRRRRDRDDEDEFDDLRPRSPRSRDRFDDLDAESERDRDRGYGDRRRPTKVGSGAATGLGVVNLVFAGLVLLCGCLNVGLSFWLRDFLKNAGPVPNVRPGQIEQELKIMLIAGAVYILGSGLFLAAGITVLKRSPVGRGLTFACVAFAVAAVLFQAITFAIAAQNGDLEDIEPPQLCGAIFAPLLWIGYIITALILLSKSVRQFR
jgi:hypothetical protein